MTLSFPPPGFVPVSSALPGIEVFSPAPKATADQAATVAFNCPRCGATTAYSAAQGGLTCTHCGYYEPPAIAAVGEAAAQAEFTPEALQETQRGWGPSFKDVECQNCGAVTSMVAESLSATCPFCGSNQVIARQASADLLRPGFLIPFKIEAAACPGIARPWLGSSWMTPSALQQAASLAGFTGIYLPYWTFDATTRAAWKGEVGHTETERYYENGEWKTRLKTVWRWESGQAELRIEDLLVEGTHRLSSLLLGQIANYAMDGLSPYEPKYLAGFQAQAYDVPLEQAWETGRAQMRERTRQACLDQASSSEVRNFSMELDFANEGWRYILLPVYLSTYAFSGKVFYIMVNGQTGAVAGQRPVDWQKIWLVIGALLAPGLLLGLIGLLTLAFGVGAIAGGIGFFLLVIGVMISLNIFRRANSLDEA